MTSRIHRVAPFKALDCFNTDDEFIDQLHKLNEQTSLILRTKTTAFKEHWEKNPPFQSSLILMTLSFLQYSPTVLSKGSDEWKREYIEILEQELTARVLKITERMLATSPGPLLRSTDLVFWEPVTKKLLNTHDDIIFRHHRTLFRAGVLLRKQFVTLLPKLQNEQLLGTDLACLCILVSAASLQAQEISTENIAHILHLLANEHDLAMAAKGLKYFARLPLWQEIDHAALATAIIKMDHAGCQILPDLIFSSEAAEMAAFAQHLQRELRSEASLESLLQALPKLPPQDARRLLKKYDGNVASVLEAEGGKFKKDEFIELLDDKSFVRSNKEYLLTEANEELYEDEHVDTFDDAGQAPTDRHIAERKNADKIAGLDAVLLRELIADPKVFARSSQTRQSKPRKALCDRVKLSHEQIEGWALMFERNVLFLLCTRTS